LGDDSFKKIENMETLMDKSSLTVVHNEAANRFEIQIESQMAELTYILQDGKITFTHTGVPPELEGNGIGSMLVKAGLQYAWEKDLKVEPLCWFVRGYIERHPESVK
jgi:predicted GNAT family acetyltransferase